MMVKTVLGYLLQTVVKLVKCCLTISLQINSLSLSNCMWLLHYFLSV